MTTLKERQKLGGGVPSAPIKKDISFKLDGDEDITATIHVKKLSSGDYENLFLGDKEKRSQTAKMISEAITLGEDGKERITFEQAYQLHPNLAGAMVNAFNEVNLAKKTSRATNASAAK